MTRLQHADRCHPPLDVLPVPRIVVVMPALNEADAIESVVRQLLRQRVVPLHDVIVVDNGSTDGTGALACAAGARVVREARRGYGAACYAGLLAAAEDDVIVLMDADAADEQGDLANIVGPIVRNEADLVVGSRTLGQIEKGAMTSRQIAGNRLTCRLIGYVYGQRVTDLGPFRAIRRRDLLRLEMREMGYGWSTEMIIKAARSDFRYREVPVRYHRRIGISKVGGNWRSSLRAGAAMLRTVVSNARWSPSATRSEPGIGVRA